MIDVLVMGRQPLALSIPPTPLQHSNTSIAAKMCFVVIDYLELCPVRSKGQEECYVLIVDSSIGILQYWEK